MKQIKNKDRVKNYGEVYTAPKEVNAMLDMIKDDVAKISSRILEPSVGTGNFLVEILNRKLKTIKEKSDNIQLKWEYYIFIAISNIYGIDILEDNILECKTRLFNIFNDEYSKLFNNKDDKFIDSIKFILDKNIIWGNSLTGKQHDSEYDMIISEWEFKRMEITRKDYYFKDLTKDEIIPIKEYDEMNFKEIFKTL